MNLAAHTQVVDSAGCSRRVCYGAARARATPSAHRRASCQHASLPRLAVKHAPLMEVAPLRRGARPAGLVVSASSTAVESAPAPASMVPYYAAFLVFGCAVNTIGPMLPLLAAQVGLSPVDMAPLLSAKGAAGLAGSFLCPLLPLAVLMPGGLLCIGLSFAAIPMVTSLLQLIVVYCFAAAVYQAVSVAAHTLIAQQHGDGAGPHLNGINALFGAGSLLAPAMHRVVAPKVVHYGPLASYWVIAAAACVAALPFVGALLRPKPQAENCFGTWLYTYALGTSGSGAASGSVSLFWGSFTAGRLLAIPVSARVAPGTILLASLPLAVLGPCIILLGAHTGAGALLYAGAVATGLGISTGFANSVSLLARYVPPTGTVQAAIQVAATLGSMTFPPAVALIAQRGVVGVEAFLYVACACAAVDIILVLLLQASGRAAGAQVAVAH